MKKHIKKKSKKKVVPKEISIVWVNVVEPFY